MKVLHVEAGRYLYGGAQQVVWLNEGLARRGVENVLVCPDRSDIAAAVGDNACVYEVGMSGDLDVGVVPRLIRILKKEQPDIVHIHSRRGADIYGVRVAALEPYRRQPRGSRAGTLPCVRPAALPPPT